MFSIQAVSFAKAKNLLSRAFTSTLRHMGCPGGSAHQREPPGLRKPAASSSRYSAPVRRLLALGLLLPACACTSDFLLDAAPAPDARTVIYFAHHGDEILEARLVEPAATRLVELQGGTTPDFEVTAVAYALGIERLGLLEGRLVPDPHGAQLPEPNAVFRVSQSSGVWEQLAEVPDFVRQFRVAASSRIGCETRFVRELEPPQKEPSKVSYATTGFSPSPASAVVYFPEVKAVVLRPDFSRIELAVQSNAPRFVATTGTIALGMLSNGCIAKVEIKDGSLSYEPWICGPYPRRLAPGAQGDFALVYDREVVIFDRSARETSRYPREPSDVDFLTCLSGETILASDGTLSESSAVTVTSPVRTRVEATNGHGEFVVALASVDGRILAGGSAGSVFERRSGSWADLGKSGIAGVADIVATPRGFLATGGSGEAAEYIDDLGWCPVVQLTNDVIDVTIRLGSGYLFYSRGSIRPKPSLTWADFGLEP